jgi:hypothetical protein
LAETFQIVVAEHTAGDPCHANIKWTNLTQCQIVVGLEKAGTPVSRFVVRQLLDEFDYRERKHSKVLSMGTHPDTDAQFEKIARLRREFLRDGDPVISMDTKKKELLGNFARPGTVYATEPVKVFDHDFGGKARRGVSIPHGLYDCTRNRGHITLGTSHDTSEFAIDSLLQWWMTQGKAAYPAAGRLLLLCDGGGSNSCRTYLFKANLQRFADETGLTVRVAHYPPYKSKYNPIEHRMFCHVDRTYRGVVLHNVDTIQDLIAHTHTSSGLEVTVSILDKAYELGLKVSQAVKDSLRYVADKVLGIWNYRVLPSYA